MNFNINLSDIGDLTMIKLLLIWLILLTCIIAWRLPEIIRAWKKTKEEQED